MDSGSLRLLGLAAPSTCPSLIILLPSPFPPLTRLDFPTSSPPNLTPPLHPISNPALLRSLYSFPPNHHLRCSHHHASPPPLLTAFRRPFLLHNPTLPLFPLTTALAGCPRLLHILWAAISHLLDRRRDRRRCADVPWKSSYPALSTSSSQLIPNPLRELHNINQSCGRAVVQPQLRVQHCAQGVQVLSDGRVWAVLRGPCPLVLHTPVDLPDLRQAQMPLESDLHPVCC